MRKLLLMLIVLSAFIPLFALGQGDSLPVCSDTELQLLNEVILPEYNALIADVFTVETVDELLDYVNDQLQWRSENLDLFPDCTEAVQIIAIVNQTASDLVALRALEFVGVSQSDNPYYEQMTRNVTRFNELTDTEETTEIIQPTATNQPIVTKTYYVTANGSVNIRSCNSTNCAVVATANRGDALTVVDDSGSWYELQLDSGETGYIADFLVGVNAPSSQPTAVPVQPTAVPQNNTQSNVQPTAIPVQPTAVPVQPTAVPPTAVPVQPTAVPPPSDAQVCGGATTCGSMGSCDQAYACLRAGNGRLDRDNDGVPCESICPGG